MRGYSIPDLERAVVQALVKVRELSAAGSLPPVLDALNVLVPRGFRVHVELCPYADTPEDEMRARVQPWDAANGEIALSFEPLRDEPREEPREERRDERREEAPRAAPTPPDVATAQRDVIAIVARAENDPSFSFLALKFLRDTLLPRQIGWARDPQEAQIQINRSIDAGILVTGKVENPRMPAYPVTTVSLNRESGLVQEVLAGLAPSAPTATSSFSSAPPAESGPFDNEPT